MTNQDAAKIDCWNHKDIGQGVATSANYLALSSIAQTIDFGLDSGRIYVF